MHTKYFRMKFRRVLGRFTIATTPLPLVNRLVVVVNGQVDGNCLIDVFKQQVSGLRVGESR
jgi:hypothetical protein